MPTAEYTGPEEFRMGPDRVVRLEDAVLVYTPREMSDWQVREFCRMPIYFRGAKYYLLRRARGEPPFAFCYELAPWPVDLFEESKLAIQYDEAYVTRRDAVEKAEEINELGRVFLLPLYPLLGFLWSRFKDQKLERFGFNPVSLTGASLYLAFGLFLGQGVLVFYLHSGIVDLFLGSGTTWLDYALLLLLPVDVVARYHQVLRGDPFPDGFFEWFFRWMRRAAGLPKQ
jgi:hypothetical protein